MAMSRFDTDVMHKCISADVSLLQAEFTQYQSGHPAQAARPPQLLLLLQLQLPKARPPSTGAPPVVIPLCPLCSLCLIALVMLNQRSCSWVRWTGESFRQ